VCEFIRGRETWRFVFPSHDAGRMIEEARALAANGGPLDLFDVSWVERLIRRATAQSGTGQEITKSTEHRGDASLRH